MTKLKHTKKIFLLKWPHNIYVLRWNSCIFNHVTCKYWAKSIHLLLFSLKHPILLSLTDSGMDLLSIYTHPPTRIRIMSIHLTKWSGVLSLLLFAHKNNANMNFPSLIPDTTFLVLFSLHFKKSKENEK